MLTKRTAWAAVVAILAWLVRRHGRRGLIPSLAFLGGFLAVSGWWFVRNVVLYGDPTAVAGVKRTGVSYAPYRLHAVSDLGHIVQQVVTYLWVPTEYVRNLISAPTVLKAVLFGFTVALLAVAFRKRHRIQDADGLSLVAVCALVSIGSWFVTYFAVQAAPRVAYMAFPMWALLVGLAISTQTRVVALGVGLAALNVWTLYELAGVAGPTFIRLAQ